MKKFFEVIATSIGVIFILLLVFTLVIGPAIFLYYAYFVPASIFNNKVYKTVEELHADFGIQCNNDPDANLVFGDIVFTVCVEQNIFVFCEYRRTNDDAMNTDYLLIYYVTKTADGYIMQDKAMGIDYGFLPLHNDYRDSDYSDQIPKCVLFCRTGTLERYAAFAYKEKGSTDILYYNGTKMQEVEQINPFTEETFVLCYAYPPETKKPFEQLFSGMERLFCGFFGRPCTQFVLTVEEGS